MKKMLSEGAVAQLINIRAQASIQLFVHLDLAEGQVFQPLIVSRSQATIIPISGALMLL